MTDKEMQVFIDAVDNMDDEELSVNTVIARGQVEREEDFSSENGPGPSLEQIKRMLERCEIEVQARGVNVGDYYEENR